MDLNRKAIDERFKNDETSGYHENCLVCNKNVLNSEEDYFIEKIKRNVSNLNLEETLFEYAMCMSCASDMRQNLSKDSMMRIEEYYKSHARLDERLSLDLNTVQTTAHCLLTGKQISSCQEYAIHAHCNGDQMILGAFPYAVSDLAMDEVSDLLSNETLDQLDDFKGKYFNGPSEFAEIISPKRFIPI